MTDLCILAHRYGTDKTFYTPFYSLLLEKRRGTIKSVLEIGIGTQAAMKHVPDYKPGASLRMWEEYFPKAYIYGMDKDASVLFETERIYTFQGDQSQPHNYPELIRRGASFDLIVDDGSHHVEHQLKTLEALLPRLSNGGIYIIEDASPDLSDKLNVPHCIVDVKHKNLTGHCVVIS